MQLGVDQGPLASRKGHEGGGDLGRLLRELVSSGHQKSWRCPPPGVDSDQQASGPWSTHNRVVEVAAGAILEQLGSEESLADRRLDLCWSPWVGGGQGATWRR